MVNRKGEFEAANKRAAAILAQTPSAAAARYDRRTGRVVIDLSSRLTVSFKPQDAQGLEEAKPEQLAKIEISPSGLGLHFPKLDADLYLPSLLEGFLGSRRWMAAQLDKSGASTLRCQGGGCARARQRQTRRTPQESGCLVGIRSNTGNRSGLQKGVQNLGPIWVHWLPKTMQLDLTSRITGLSGSTT
jgi:hypothetical protein